MSVLLAQLEIALHDADCPGHDENFKGHGDKYQKLAKAAASVFPSEREPYWLQDRKLVQESSLNKIMEMLLQIDQRLDSYFPAPKDEAYNAAGLPYSQGRCDTCGSPCDDHGCKADRNHLTALA